MNFQYDIKKNDGYITHFTEHGEQKPVNALKICDNLFEMLHEKICTLYKPYKCKTGAAVFTGNQG